MLKREEYLMIMGELQGDWSKGPTGSAIEGPLRPAEHEAPCHMQQRSPSGMVVWLAPTSFKD